MNASTNVDSDPGLASNERDATVIVAGRFEKSAQPCQLYLTFEQRPHANSQTPHMGRSPLQR